MPTAPSPPIPYAHLHLYPEHQVHATPLYPGCLDSWVLHLGPHMQLYGSPDTLRSKLTALLDDLPVDIPADPFVYVALDDLVPGDVIIGTADSRLPVATVQHDTPDRIEALDDDGAVVAYGDPDHMVRVALPRPSPAEVEPAAAEAVPA
ncbi:MAG TPA: hypothetical protein VGB14_01745 [Acidimicrobiales bacterium]|jgi:hypothetical protein